MTTVINKNPFEVQTPEGMKAEDVIELFVDVFTDFYHVPRQGHTFLNGPRGSGKSMMFRFMLPDCQTLHLNKKINQLDYFSIYIPIKMTSINIVDVERLERHANIMLNEHLLTMYAATKTFYSLSQYFESFEDSKRDCTKVLSSFYLNDFNSLLDNSGYTGDKYPLVGTDTIASIFSKIQKICDRIYQDSLYYIKRLTFSKDMSEYIYSGPICSYLDFLFPLLSKIKKLPLFPDRPIFLLIDDADNLSDIQKKILNTWVSYRTSAEVSLKISTQLNYNIFRTVSGVTIDTPHDYSEVNIATVYTSSKNKYRERIREIVNQRLKKVGIQATADNFFPANEKQEKRIREIYEKIKEDYLEKGQGYRPGDDAYRYATSEYIKELKKGRSGSTYSYSGFKQLVHISSGIIRLFLEPAASMYSEMVSIHPGKPITCINPSVQNDKIIEYSYQFMFQEFDKMKKDEENLVKENGKTNPLNVPEKMRNLINGMGGLFHEILVSDRSERRVFSIALTDTPDAELSEVINLAVRNGYLTESSIGDKDRIGRCRLFILSRLLAPYFFLDPSSYAAYKYMSSSTLKIALKDYKSFIKTVLKKRDEESGTRYLFPEEEL